MTVRDAEPGDIYVDDAGKMWRCVGYCNEPVAYFEEVENGHTGRVVASHWQRQRLSGGISGLMWKGWARIFRPKEHSPEFDEGPLVPIWGKPTSGSPNA